MSEKMETRARLVLDAAYAIAAESGMAALNRDSVATRAGASTGTVSNAFGSMDGLREAVMGRAVECEALALIRQGIALQHPVALAAPADLQRRALAALA